HAIVHGRNEQHGRVRGEQAGAEQVVRAARRGARKKIRRSRRDHDQRGGASERDVIERMSLGDELRVHRPSRERLEGHRADELTGGPRQHRIHFGPGRREEPGEPRRLVTRDSPSDAEENAPALVRAHGSSIRGRCRGGAGYSDRRRGTTRYSMLPPESSSSERVGSFFLPLLERSRGNSFSTRAYFAATRIARYLFAAWTVTSFGVNTRMVQDLMEFVTRDQCRGYRCPPSVVCRLISESSVPIRSASCESSALIRSRF